MLIAVLVVGVLAGCGQKSEGDDEKTDEGTATKRVALIVNQKFGDGGSTDQMKAGLTRASEEFGFELKTLESDGVANHEEDIRAIAKDGYDLIFTTYPDMTEGTVAVANDYPDTAFAAVYQFINSPDESVANVYDMQFELQESFYLAGMAAATISPTGHIGLITGAEEASPNAESNGFMEGVKKVNPDAIVEFAFVGSYEDVAKSKEIAKAMIEKGCDVLQTNGGKDQIGVMEAAKEAGNVLVSGDTSDYSENYPEGTYTYSVCDFDNAVYLAAKDYFEGNLQLGSTGIMGAKNGTAYMSDALYDNFVKLNPDYAEKIEAVKKVIAENKAAMDAGTLTVDFNDATPDWANIK
jgi:basic membrane protein A